MTDAQPPAPAESSSDEVSGVGFLYYFVRWGIAPLARLIYWPHIEGRQHIPRTGPVILASNDNALCGQARRLGAATVGAVDIGALL